MAVMLIQLSDHKYFINRHAWHRHS